LMNKSALIISVLIIARHAALSEHTKECTREENCPSNDMRHSVEISDQLIGLIGDTSAC